MDLSDSKAETRQTEQRVAGHSERSGRSLAQSTVTTQHHNTPGLTHRELFWQTSIQRGETWLVGLRVRWGERTVLTWEYERERGRGSHCLWFVLQFGCQWCDEIVKISAQPVAEPNKDADVGRTVGPRSSWNVERIWYAESSQESKPKSPLLTLWSPEDVVGVFFGGFLSSNTTLTPQCHEIFTKTIFTF